MPYIWYILNGEHFCSKEHLVVRRSSKRIGVFTKYNLKLVDMLQGDVLWKQKHVKLLAV